jgi:hypothetical protein
MNKQIVKGLDLIDLRVHPVMTNGVPAIELRKVFTFCEKNHGILAALLETAFSNEPIIVEVPVSIKFTDNALAKYKLLRMGINIEHL